MSMDVEAHNLAGSAQSVRLDTNPDACPVCHRSIHPRLITIAIQPENERCQAIFRCTHRGCQSLFIADYRLVGPMNIGRPSFLLTSVAPRTAKPIDSPQTVRELSPTFALISEQVESAEAAQLDQLVGIGLRKALEFLMKDFAVSQHPEKEDAIRKSLLASCIGEYVTDANVKECAKRAAWLGNDETHYTRKWESKDVKDLRTLVRLTVNWIDNVLLTKKYVEEMGSGH